MMNVFQSTSQGCVPLWPCFFIVVSTAATLFRHGVHVETTADAAQALAPLAGRYAEALFAVGLFGDSMLAAGVLPLATA